MFILLFCHETFINNSPAEIKTKKNAKRTNYSFHLVKEIYISFISPFSTINSLYYMSIALT